MQQEKRDDFPLPGSSRLWLAVGNTEKEEKKPEVHPLDIVGYTERHFNLKNGCFTVKRRGPRRFTDIKHMLRSVLRETFQDLSLKDVGLLTCRADHSTVHTSLDAHADNLKYSPAYREVFKKYIKALAEAGLINEKP